MDMDKLVFLAAFLAAMVTLSAAQGMPEQSLADAQCRREVQEKPLLACRQILEHQLTGRVSEAGAVGIPLFEAQWGARERCCQQLQGVSRECRCAALRGMVRDYEQSMPPLGEVRHGSSGEHQQEQGCYGESTSEQQRPGQGHCGGKTGESRQHGGGYHGVTVGRSGQQGQVLCLERPQQQQHGEGEGFSGERAQQKPQVGRVRLTKARQYVGRLSTVCRIEPQECSVFSADQYWASA